MLVIAEDNGEAGLFVVDPKDPSITQTALWSTSFEPQSHLVLSNTPASRIGGKDAAEYLIQHMIIGMCAYQVGVSEKMVSLTSEYASEREQFGVKIATFQAVGHRTANCYIDAKCLKLVTQQAASLLAEGADASTAVNVAKAWCGDAGHRISYSAQHLHGGMGVDRDYPLWRYALWSKQNELLLGNTSHQLKSLGNAIAAGNFDIDP
jgi:alkylation response protein AidB-like acyl-CoA dehydrogenase